MAKFGPILELQPKELNTAMKDSQPLVLMPFSGSLLKHFTLPITLCKTSGRGNAEVTCMTLKLQISLEGDPLMKIIHKTCSFF